MTSRYVLFAAVYPTDRQAIDGLRVLSAAGRDEVAGPGLLHRDAHGRTTLQEVGGSLLLRGAGVGLAVGLAAGLGTQAMWATGAVGAVIGAVVGHRDRSLETRELDWILGERVPPGGYAVVAVAAQELAERLVRQFDLALSVRVLPIRGSRLSTLARTLARGNAEVTRALDAR